MLAQLAQISSSDMVPIIAMSIGGGIAIVAIVFGAYRSVSVNSSREKTRREIAAYIAEGSMTPEEGERLLVAGRSEGGKC